MNKSPGFCLDAFGLTVISVLTGTGGCAPAQIQMQHHNKPPSVQFNPQISSLDARMPLSFSNRFLLNRLAVDGERQAQVMLLINPVKWSDFEERVEKLSGNIRFSDQLLGYARVELPTEHLPELIRSPLVDSYHFASKARGTWYRDAATEELQNIYRKTEIMDRPTSSKEVPTLPTLQEGQAAGPGYAGLEGTGLTTLQTQNPTFDGRGVTLAIVENAAIQWDHPSVADALTLKGEPIGKLAGVIYSVDSSVPDEARIKMKSIAVQNTWFTEGARTYVLPNTGEFLFGKHEMWLENGLRQSTGILWDRRSRRFWVDVNGDGNFQNDKPLAGINDDAAAHAGKIGYMQIGREGHSFPFTIDGTADGSEAYLYFPPSNHQSMTASVAVGATVPGSLARGFAPAARLLLVRASEFWSDYLEGLIRAARHAEVDLIASARSSVYPDTDTSVDFRAQIIGRIINTYRKPIFQAALNYGPPLQSAGGAGFGFSVGGYVSPSTYRSFIEVGSAPIDLVLSGFSSYGPALDGSLQPDFLAPMHLLSIARSDSRSMALPVTNPVVATPPGYERSCCTSSSSPAGGGLGAVLISAAKQMKLDHSPLKVSRALYAGAHSIEGLAHFAQGAGVVNVENSWKELLREVEPIQIEFKAPLVDRMSQYSASPNVGAGLYEREGWSIGMVGWREIQMRRTSGPTDPVTYRLGWRNPSEVFFAPEEVTLPLGETVSVPINIRVNAAGAHGALLELHDEESDAIVAWLPLTVVVPEPNDAAGIASVSSELPVMVSKQHFITVPRGASAFNVELEIKKGNAILSIVPPNHLWPQYHPHLWEAPRYRGPGRYYLRWPNPTPGVWGLALRNDPFLSMREGSSSKPSPAIYRMRTSTASAVLTVNQESDDTGPTTLVRVEGRKDLILRSATGQRWQTEKKFALDGLSDPIDIKIPPNMGIFRLQATSKTPLDLYLFDCVTGRCFSYDFRLPGDNLQEILVRNPKPGLWKAVVSPSARWSSSEKYHLEVVVAGVPTAIRNTSAPTKRQNNEPSYGLENISYIEAIDPVAEYNERVSPLIGNSYYQRLQNRPIPLATLVVRDLNNSPAGAE